MNNMVFVFGSNLAGNHGAGAARYALDNHGAIYGQGMGHQGNSYAIPTKDSNLNTMRLSTISEYVDMFLEYARKNPHLTFKVTRVGCGLAGYSSDDIAPMFIGASDNCYFDTEWYGYLGGSYNYWGTQL